MILTGVTTTTAPVDWDSPTFGTQVHVAAYVDAERSEDQ